MNTDYYFSYLDFPQIPEELLPTSQEVIDYPYWSNGEKFESMRHPWAREFYHRKKVSRELKQWLVENIKIEGKWAVMFCIFNTLMKPHRDIRDETCNFILDPGGVIRTEWYNKQEDGPKLATWDSIRPDSAKDLFVPMEEIVTLESVLIEPRRWHRIKTDLVHGTNGPQTGPRIILSLITLEMVRIPKDPLLAEAIYSWFEEW